MIDKSLEKFLMLRLTDNGFIKGIKVEITKVGWCYYDLEEYLSKNNISIIDFINNYMADTDYFNIELKAIGNNHNYEFVRMESYHFRDYAYLLSIKEDSPVYRLFQDILTAIKGGKC